MNPLDKEELTEILKIIKKDMPVHTDNTARIKSSYSQGLPKNLMEYSNKINNKFLNDNLHTIEELEYRKKGITNNFKEYQNKYYDESGILNHDLYFKHENTIYPKLKGACGFIINPYSVKPSQVNGATLQTQAKDDTQSNTANEIVASKLVDLGTIGHFYDQVAHSIFTAVGTYIQATYDNSGSLPNNRMSLTGTETAVAGYNFISVTEYALTTTQNWTCRVCSSNSLFWNTSNASPQGRYGGNGSPTAIWNDMGIAAQQVSKIAHS